MPVYNYKCECGWSGEFQRKIGDHITECPKCGKPVKPRISPVTRVWGKGGKP